MDISQKFQSFIQPNPLNYTSTLLSLKHCAVSAANEWLEVKDGV